MFSPLARSRALAFLFLSLPSVSYSREESLFTSSVTYCNPPETLLIQRFDVAYFAKNQSVSFNISAASVQPNVNVSANLFLNVYGINPVNLTIDLCTILGGALCPLPMYNFTGADSLSLPDSLGVAGKIPGIAFKIPDLEGFAQLSLTDVKTGAVRACVQATLSNGWSAHQPAVEWATGGVVIAAFVSAAWHSLYPDALAPFRLLDLIYLFQSIASSAFLSLNYPSVYRSFALNFAWAVGLFSSKSSSLQSAIDHMRHLTGGKLANSTDSSAVGLVNRKLSPYNVVPVETVSSLLAPRDSDLDLAGYLFNLSTKYDLPPTSEFRTNLAQLSAIQNGDVQTVTAGSSNILQAGMPIYVNSIHIATANAFMTVFIVVLIMFAIALGIFVALYGFLRALRLLREKRQKRPLDFSFDFTSFVRAWTLRLGIIVIFPILIFVFYQWTLKDSWLSIFLAVISFLSILTLIAYPIFLTLRLAKRTSAFSLYAPSTHLSSYAPLYAQYRPPRYYFLLPLLFATLLKSIFLSAAKSNGEVQVILILIVEAILVAAHPILRPFPTRGGDIFSTFLAIIRMVTTGLLIAFVERLQVKAIPRVVIGIVIAIIFSVTIIIVIINLLLHAGLHRLFRRAPRDAQASSLLNSPQASDDSMLEKGDAIRSHHHNENSTDQAYISHASSWDHTSQRPRPLNPTPEHNIPLEPNVLVPYPISPTATTATSVSIPSLYSRDSTTITVGSLMPSRWSFSLSQPNSPTSSVTHERLSQSLSLSTPATPSPLASTMNHGMESVEEESGEVDRTAFHSPLQDGERVNW